MKDVVFKWCFQGKDTSWSDLTNQTSPHRPKQATTTHHSQQGQEEVRVTAFDSSTTRSEVHIKRRTIVFLCVLVCFAVIRMEGNCQLSLFGSFDWMVPEEAMKRSSKLDMCLVGGDLLISNM